MTRMWKWLIGVSLGLNLFLLAVIGGAAFVMSRHVHDFKRPMGMQQTRDVDKRLSPASLQRIYAVVRQAALAGEPDLDKARHIRGEAAKLAADPTFDGTKMAALSDEARGYEDQARAKVENALIQAMESLSPEERASIASHMLLPSFKFRHLNHDGKTAGAPRPGVDTETSASR